ncbi:TPA: hypothetical protein ACXDAY_002786 [Clostridium botulinum]|uniref:hypothetical protein n=1 Tax=Clostridium botulinum TaxID=1491 RepID=UPI00035BA9D5|nr:hypothetical protein [Clostridium botulinum]EPS56537.1 hypothetical protein CLQ_02426 [Clostridium botulinum Af84]MBN3351484.1 hypothetical protein [Clostridium botulinum]MBN3358762.1 hypothetical protein [Clostridium botulinum]NFM83301.1 hypothetical protein [Clostridium botulinum]NFP09854.1 hypothetical protein [Clostridium botulinum]
MKSFLKTLLIVLICIVIAGFAFFKMATYQGDQGENLSDNSIKNENILDKLKNVELSKGTLTVNEEDVNEMLKVYFQNEKNVGSILVKSVKVDTKDNKLNLYVPVRYNGIDLLMSSYGDVSARDDKIIYKVDSIKMGKVSVPKSILLNEIKKSNMSNIQSNGDEIIIDKGITKVKIKDIKIEDGKFKISF